MRKLLAALMVGAFLVTVPPAIAQAATVFDDRMVEVDYVPGAVYRIAGAYRTATQVVFSPDETIRHVAVGDSVSWEVAAEGSVLFLKPRERLQPTNLLVVTERGGVTRHYAFELAARDAGGGVSVVYQIRFRYPADVQAATAASLATAQRAIETRLVDLSLQQGAYEGPRNLAYSLQGATALQPSEVSDNGRFTVLRFPANQPIPAIYVVSPEGEEQLAPFDVRGEFVIVHSVSPGLRLRRGRAVLCIFNEAFDPRGAATGTATASSGVERNLTTGARP
jgi:type IV secretion system protein VirB9